MESLRNDSLVHSTENIEEHATDWVRITLYTIGFLLKVGSIYLMAAVALYRCKTKRHERRVEKRSVHRGIFKAKRTKYWNLNEFCLLTSIFAFLSCISDSPVFSLNQTTDLTCKITQGISSLFYACGTVSLYSFLWMRQRACYRNRSLRILQNLFTRLLSKFVLPIYLVLKVVGIVLTCTVWDFKTSESGCYETSHSVTPVIVMYVAAVIMHVVLLTLFLKPLKHHLKFGLKSIAANDGSKTSDDRLQKLVKRCVLSTSLCVFSDTVSFVSVFAMPHFKTRSILSNYIYDVELLLNILFINGSFADWKRRLFPWKFQLVDKDLDGPHPDFISSTLTRSASVKTTTAHNVGPFEQLYDHNNLNGQDHAETSLTCDAVA